MADKKSDNVEYPERGYNTEDVRSVPVAPKRRRWWLWALTALVLAPAAVFAAWAAITLNVTYSRGERAGIVQKFSRKGWLCKTWEGELTMIPTAYGVPSERFAFTVRDDSVAAVINDVVRQGGRVALDYEQHRGVPSSCFGETQYFVTGAQSGEPRATTPPTAPSITPAATPTAPTTVPATAPPTATPPATTPPASPVTTPPPATPPAAPSPTPAPA